LDPSVAPHNAPINHVGQTDAEATVGHAMAAIPAKKEHVLRVFQTATEKYAGRMAAEKPVARVKKVPIAPTIIARQANATKRVAKDLSPPLAEGNAIAMEPASSTTIAVKVSVKPAQRKARAVALNAVAKSAETMDVKEFAEIATQAIPARTSFVFPVYPNAMGRNVATTNVAVNVAIVEMALNAKTSSALSANPNVKTMNVETTAAGEAVANATMNPFARGETA
jgi:hypothetical protein